MNSSMNKASRNLVSTEKKGAEFSEFYDKYAPALYGNILRIVEKEEIAKRVFTKVLLNAFREKNIDAPKLLSQFTIVLNHSRKKSGDMLKAIKMFQACNESRECIAQHK